jgi:hypothetical protein
LCLEGNPQVPKVFLGLWLLIPLQLPLAPMRLLAIGVHALGAMMQPPQHSHAGVKQWAVILCSHDQGLSGGLPAPQFLLRPG